MTSESRVPQVIEHLWRRTSGNPVHAVLMSSAPDRIGIRHPDGVRASALKRKILVIRMKRIQVCAMSWLWWQQALPALGKYLQQGNFAEVIPATITGLMPVSYGGSFLQGRPHEKIALGP